MSDKTVIIAEKPDAAKRITNALAEEGVETKRSSYNVTYYEFKRAGKRYLVVPAVGHLFNLKQKGKGWTYPVYDSEWIPSYKAKKEDSFSEKYFKTIEAVTEEGEDYIVACDLDEEGSLIGANIVKFICKADNAKRMNFSTLTKSDLIEAFEEMSPGLDFNLIEAGESRHRLDWLYGVNITRALTLALNNQANLGFQVISAGRVQTPTLKLLLEREKEIREFDPTPYWQIRLKATIRGEELSAFHVEGKFWEEQKAKEIFRRCRGVPPKISKIKRRKYRQKPPIPFNLTKLQTEAYRFFGYAPNKTLNIAEELYRKGFISYPRTSSQKLPAKIGYRKILKALTNLGQYEHLAGELLGREDLHPREGKKSDPAHVAIYPTHEPPKPLKKKLTSRQKKVYDLIVRRFLATFAESALRESMKVIMDVKDEKFQIKGRRTLRKNWHRFYAPYVGFKETVLPELSEGETLTPQIIELLDKETQPPSRYTSASLVKLMDEKGLGTRATRSKISKILFERGYLRGNSIKVTRLGEAVIDLLEEYCPKITSIELTREFEQKIEKVREGKLNKENVLAEAKQVLQKVLQKFKEKEEEIGKKLATSFKEAQKAKSYLGECPECGNELRIIHSKKTHKRFVGCTGFFKGVCDFSAPLPQKGRIQPIDTKCKYCGYPMVMVMRKGNKKPWFLCLNPDCPAKEKDEE